ncbi:hypothetical protein EMG21_31035, partial [Klebsiella pneumoniae]
MSLPARWPRPNWRSPGKPRKQSTGLASLGFGESSMFDDDYWATQRVLLDTEYDIRHVNFAKFVHDHCGDSTVYVEGIGWHRWTGTHWQATADEAPAMQTITDATQILLKRAGESAGDMRWASSAASKMLVASHRAYIVREMKFLPEFRRDV